MLSNSLNEPGMLIANDCRNKAEIVFLLILEKKERHHEKRKKRS
jgi:hypothetical protein